MENCQETQGSYEKLEFTQRNVDAKINEIKSLSKCAREEVVNQIKSDLRAWLLMTFKFTRLQERCMSVWPLSLREETGFGIGTALLYDEWNLVIIFPMDTTPSAVRKTEQSVSGSYNTGTGAYTVTKTYKWSNS